MQQAQHARGWNFLPKLTFVITIGLITAATGFQARAIDVFTPSVGFYQLPAVTNQDTYVSNPFTRIPESQGVVSNTASAGGGLNILQAGAAAGFSAGQWTFPATSALDGTVSNTYYVVITSGAKNGSWYQITNNDAAGNLYIDTPVEDLTGVTATDTYKIIPFWTLGTMFPSGSGVQASTSQSTGSRRTQVLFPAITGTGINLAPGAQTFYFLQTATLTNWVQVGSGTINFNTQIIMPDMYLVVRQAVPSASTTVVALGAVSTWNARTPLYTLTTGPQDNFVTVYRPAAQALTNLGFSASNGFLVSATVASGARRDQILTLDNVSSGINKAPGGQTYFLTPGAGGGDSGWRIVGGGATDVGGNTVQGSGVGFVVRKFQTNAVNTVIWSNAPNY